MTRRLHKSKNRLVLGVAGGLAEYFTIDPAIIRAGFILLAFAGGAGIVLYLLLALLMPAADATSTEPLDVVKENLRTAPREATEAGRRVVQGLRGRPEERESEGQGPRREPLPPAASWRTTYGRMPPWR